MARKATKTRPTGFEEYYERLARGQLAPLWEVFEEWFTPTPRRAATPYLWQYKSTRPLLLESARTITPEEAERRVLILENPGLAGRRLITESLYAGLQLITPGEIAPAHRHSPAALRFIIEGSGAYTAVRGEKAYMEPGDFIITPSWNWHDHGHEGTGPTVWLDVLDVPIVQLLGAMFTEHHANSRYPEERPPHDSLYRYGMNMLPVGYERSEASSPIFSYPYARSREALERLKNSTDWDPCHGLTMEYIDPTSGAAAIPTISTFIQLLPKAFATEPYRSTDAKVLCVVEGRGEITIGEGASAITYAYAPHDICAVPSWLPLSILAEEESVLFSASDRVIQQKLGLWRERRGA